MKKYPILFFLLFFFIFSNAQFTQEWVSHYNGTDTHLRNDYAKKVGTDSQKNVYVFGDSDDNMMLIRYDSAGNHKWSVNLNGSDNGVDIAKDLCVDSLGFIYIAGVIKNNVTGNDAFVAKFDSTGNAIWTVKYDITNGTQGANAIAVDTNGYVYVAGYHSNACLTLKLDPAGNTVWSKIYTTFAGPGQLSDVALDDHGNVFVTGYNGVSGAAADWLTMKYDPLGNLIWNKTKGGTANTTDFAAGIVVDSLSNVYVAGTISNNVTDGDALVICYDSLGNIQWSNSYDGSLSYHDNYNALVMRHGKIYLTGRASITTGEGVLTRTFSSGGSLLWSHVYAAPGVTTGYELVLNSFGELYVACLWSGTGSPGITLKYGSSGTLNWARPVAQGTHAISLDASGHVLVAGTITAAQSDFGTIKYDSAGTLIWSRAFESGYANEVDRVAAIRIDNNGNTYVCGSSEAVPAGTDWYLQKIDPSGSTEWIRNFSGYAPGSGDIIQSMEIDGDNNVVVGGFANAFGGHSDATVIKYDPAGNVLWTYSYNTGIMVGESAYVSDIAIDNAKYIYITGRIGTNPYGDNMYTAKIDPNGNQVWVRTLDGTYSEDDLGNNVHVDASGNVYVSGGVRNGYSLYEIFLRKYDPAGTILWTRTYSGTATTSLSSIYSTSLMEDPAGNLVVGGKVKNAGTGDDYVLRKYDPSGNFIWAKTFYFDVHGNSVMGEDGSIYTIGDSVFTGIIKVYKTDIAGNLVWGHVVFPGLMASNYAATLKYECMQVKNNKLYLVGEGTNSVATSGRDFVLIQYDSVGNEENVNYFDSGINAMNDDAVAVAVNDHGNIYVSGFSGVNSGTDIYTLKYCNNAPVQLSTVVEGDSVVCSGSVYTYAVPFSGASGYSWNYSGTGATLATNDNEVSVSFPTGATNGILSVTESNACGTSVPATISIIVGTVVSASLTVSQDTVCSTSGPLILTGSPSGGVYSGPAVSGSTFNPAIGFTGSANTITYIYTDSNSCSSTASIDIYVEVCTGVPTNDLFSASIYPNPVSSAINLEVASVNGMLGRFIFELMDVTGRVVKTETFNTLNKTIEREELSSGIYFYKLRAENSFDALQGKLIFK